MGSWRRVRYGDVTLNVRTRADANSSTSELLSVTATSGVIRQSQSGRRDISAVDKSRYLMVEPGDVVYNTMRMWQGVSGLSGMHGIVSPAYTVLRPLTQVLDGCFLAHLMKLPDNIQRYRANSQGLVSDTWNLKFESLASLDLNLPPLKEQKRIAEILDTIDEATQAAERVIDKQRDIERGLRRDMLDGKFEGARFEDWTRCRIGDFASVQRGASPRPIDNPAWFSSDGPGWIRISDVTAADDLLLRTRDHLSPAGVARSRSVRPGDVIMSIAGTIGVAIVVGIEACYHDGFVRIDHDGSVVPEFLVMLLEHHKQDFIRSGQTGTQANINSSIVAATQVSLPSLEIQSEIVTATSAVRRAIRAEKDTCWALHAMRAGLADDLLSGRVRTVAA